MILSKELRFAYSSADGGQEPALDGIDMEIRRGEFVAIIGPNGSGKSTLARHINALLAPSSGTVWVNGLDTGEPDNVWKVRQSAGMVFQNPDNQLVAALVEDDVAFGPENLGLPPAEIARRVKESLAALGMQGHERTPPHLLSGGQKQRVAIAGVLAMRPECVVMDEATAMLDPAGRKEVMAAAARLNKEEGMCVVLITHSMDEALAADRVLVMRGGKLALDGPPREVFAQYEKMDGLGLDVPFFAGLARELAKIGMEIGRDVMTEDDFVDCPAVARALSNWRPGAARPAAPAAGGETAIETSGLGHVYGKGTVFEKEALSGVSLEIKAGQIAAVIGHTGSGKSTLAQHFNGLLLPHAGSVSVFGRQLDKKSARELRRKVGLVFQFPEHQLFEATVIKDVEFGPTMLGRTAAEARRDAEGALGMVGLGAEFYEKSPFELSGGQKRRAAIAGVLAMRPSALVLDEPAAGLDPAAKKELLARLRELNAGGLTVVLVSHSMEDVAEMADVIFVMSRGRIEMQGTPEAVFADAGRLRGIGLDAPRSAALFGRLGIAPAPAGMAGAVAAFARMMRGGAGS